MTQPKWEDFRSNGLTLADYSEALARYDAGIPRHAKIGTWLKANPVPGVEAVEPPDGLGPRARGWPDGLDHPDVDGWLNWLKIEEAKRREALEQEKLQLQQDVEEVKKMDAPLSRLVLKLLEL